MDPPPPQLDVLLYSVGCSPQELPRAQGVCRLFRHSLPLILSFPRLLVPTCSAKDPAPPFVAADPDIRKYDGERVHCKACNSWISVGSEGQAAQAWSQHRAQCKQASPAAPPPPASVTSAAAAPKHPRYAAPSSPAVQVTYRAKMLSRPLSAFPLHHSTN